MQVVRGLYEALLGLTHGDEQAILMHVWRGYEIAIALLESIWHCMKFVQQLHVKTISLCVWRGLCAVDRGSTHIFSLTLKVVGS